MPQPIEAGEQFGRLKVLARAPHGYLCNCTRCKGSVVVAAKSLRLKHADVDCRLCFPARRQPRPVVVYSKRGYPLLEEAA